MTLPIQEDEDYLSYTLRIHNIIRPMRKRLCS